MKELQKKITLLEEELKKLDPESKEYDQKARQLADYEADLLDLSLKDHYPDDETWDNDIWGHN